MFSDETWNRINAVTGPIGMVLAMLLLAALMALLSPLYLWSWMRRKMEWGWQPRTS